MSAGRLRPALDAEERHDAVTRVLVRDAAGLGNGAPYRFEIAVEEEDDVVGQLVLGETGEAAKIGKEHGDLALLPVMRSARRMRRARARCHCDERRHRQIPARAKLAGQAHVGRRADALEHAQLLRARRRQGRVTRDPDPAGRAATATAADRGVRDAGRAAGLEHGRSNRHGDAPAIGIGDPHHGPTRGEIPAHAAREQGQQQQGPGAVPEPVSHALEGGPLRRRGGACLDHEALDKAGLARESAHLPSRLGKAQISKDGHEHERAEDQGEEARIPAAEPQPEVQTHAAVAPRDHEERRLTVKVPGIEHPEEEHDPRVEILGAVHGIGQSRAHDVGDEQGRHGQPEDDLRRLPHGHAQCPAPVEQPEGE